MNIVKTVEKAADATSGNFKLALVKTVLGATAGFLATVATQKTIDAVVKNNTSTATIIPPTK